MEVALPLVGEVNAYMLEKFLEGVARLSDDDTLVVHLSTEGGDVSIGIALHDLIKREGNVTIFVHGACMSAGMIVLAAAKTRVSMPNAQFMIHFGEETNSSPTEAKHNIRISKLMRRLIGNRAKITKRTVNNWFKTNAYFTAKDALEYGLIDRIEDL